MEFHFAWLGTLINVTGLIVGDDQRAESLVYGGKIL